MVFFFFFAVKGLQTKARVKATSFIVLKGERCVGGFCEWSDAKTMQK